MKAVMVILVIVLTASCSPSVSYVPQTITTMSTPALPSNVVVVTAASQPALAITATVKATLPAVISESDFLNGVILEIPRIQITSVLKIARQDREGELDFSSIEENPVLVETRQIGENGVALIMGHRQWGIYPKVFAELDRLESGDIIIVRTDGIEITFEVKGSIIVLPSDVWQELTMLDALFAQREIPAVVLMTCTPYGTNQKRLMVVAVMLKGEE